MGLIGLKMSILECVDHFLFNKQSFGVIQISVWNLSKPAGTSLFDNDIFMFLIYC